MKHRNLTPYKSTETFFLKGELSCEFKNEYIGGIVYPMHDITNMHNLLTGNVVRLFGNHQKVSNTNYNVMASMMKVRVGQDYYYPDVGCYLYDNTHEYYQILPIVLLEVLSDESRDHDLKLKYEAYKLLPSLKEYLVVEQNQHCIYVFKKSEKWKCCSYFSGDSLLIDSINLRLTVDDLYS